MQERTAGKRSEDSWKVFQPVKVGDKNRIDVVEALEDLVYDHPFDGKSVYWWFDTENEVIVVSNGSLGSSRFEDYGRTDYYVDNGKIVPPANLRELVVGEIYHGDTVYYLSDSVMHKSETCSAFVLTAEQVSREIESIKPVRIDT